MAVAALVQQVNAEAHIRYGGQYMPLLTESPALQQVVDSGAACVHTLASGVVAIGRERAAQAADAVRQSAGADADLHAVHARDRGARDALQLRHPTPPAGAAELRERRVVAPR